VVGKQTDSLTTLKIHSDSRHALEQLETGPAFQDERYCCKIWEKLVTISEKSVENHVVNLIWVYGHAGVEGNELADRAAKEGRLRSQSEADIDMGSAMRQL